MHDKIDDSLYPEELQPQILETDSAETIATMAGLSIESAANARLIAELHAELDLTDTNIRKVEDFIRDYLEEHDQSSNSIYTLSGDNPGLYSRIRPYYVLIAKLRAKKKRLLENLASYET